MVLIFMTSARPTGEVISADLQVVVIVSKDESSSQELLKSAFRTELVLSNAIQVIPGLSKGELNHRRPVCNSRANLDNT